MHAHAASTPALSASPLPSPNAMPCMYPSATACMTSGGGPNDDTLAVRVRIYVACIVVVVCVVVSIVQLVVWHRRGQSLGALDAGTAWTCPSVTPAAAVL